VLSANVQLYGLSSLQLKWQQHMPVRQRLAHLCVILRKVHTPVRVSLAGRFVIMIADAAVLPEQVRSNAGAPHSRVGKVDLRM
jgi:hypothetical protein